MACGVQQIFLETSNKVCYNAETENKWWHIRENARVKRNETDMHRRQPDLRIWCAAVPAVDKAVRAGDRLGDRERRHQRGHDRRYAGAAAALLAERDICVQRPLVLLMGGANDIFFSGTDTGARANMGAMLNQLLSLGVHTMIGIPTPICAENAPPAWAAVVDFRSAERQLEQYCAWLRRFSKCFGAECIDFRADFFDPNGRLKRELLLDGLHPTPEGHQIMARRLCAHLKRERQG